MAGAGFITLKIRHYPAPLQYTLLAAYDITIASGLLSYTPSKQGCAVSLTDKSDDNAMLELPYTSSAMDSTNVTVKCSMTIAGAEQALVPT
jgi:hypothetical protein